MDDYRYDYDINWYERELFGSFSFIGGSLKNDRIPMTYALYGMGCDLKPEDSCAFFRQQWRQDTGIICGSHTEVGETLKTKLVPKWSHMNIHD